ncbi:bifunctional DNA primase/polymerase [Streptomyces sp. NPDC007875]|uniref:bifunctional DNA primase/polymerase n=1 Tax=Streptomyces sp. NPDC007875 TaxID=3364783 RepID=UPI0036C3DCE2
MSVRDVQAVIEASGSVRHGTTVLGGSFTGCTCPKTRCGGVAAGTERGDCPEHRRDPAQLWHWDADCPVPTALTAARSAVWRGLAVFPLPAGGRVPEPGWQQLATLDEDVLPELFDGGRNVGIACRASAVVVLDLDVHHGDGPVHNGAATLRAQIDAQGLTDWPDTFTVATPSGGLHLYFRVPADCTIGSSSGALGPGIDVRGPGRRSGGYLVGPGSLVGGLPYLVEHNVPVAPLPDWIADRLRAEEARCRTGRPQPQRATP